MIHPLSAVRLHSQHHPAPAWPQIEPQIAPTHWVRVPDCPIFEPGDPDVLNVRQNWAIGPGWVVGWRAQVSKRYERADDLLWEPSESDLHHYAIQIAANSWDRMTTDSEIQQWIVLGHLHSATQGWLPWLRRIEPGDVWTWSHRYSGLAAAAHKRRVEIGLAYVADVDLAARVGDGAPSLGGIAALARTFPTRWIRPPEPQPSLAPGQQSALRRLDWQNTGGELVCWSGGASYSEDDQEVIVEGGGGVPMANIEVQASWNNGEHLVVNGSGADWMSLSLLFGAGGGRRVQPLCRRFDSKDTLGVRLRNVADDPDGTLEIKPDVVFGWRRDDDPLPPRGA